MPFTDEHVEHYREHGYVIAENFLSAEEFSKAPDAHATFIPGWLDYAANPKGPKPEGWDRTGRTRRDTRFPFAGAQLNAITLHPELRRLASVMAGNSELYCEQSDLTWKCKGHQGDQEQRFHLDYGNHTLAYPPALPDYWQTAYLIYYTDVDENCAPTAVCSWQHYKDEVQWPSAYTREERSELYDNEVMATVPAGAVLAYSMRTFHRGTAFKAHNARIGQFVTYAPAAWKWLGIIGLSEQSIRPEFRALI